MAKIGTEKDGVAPANRTLLAVERQNQILEILEREGAARSSELRDFLNVSLVTVRSDLRDLEAKGLVDITRGGAVSKRPPRERELVVLERSALNVEKKRRIGACAGKLVSDGQTILVDAGTTTIEVINHLSRTLEYVKVITPALNIASVASQMPNVEVVILGGIVRPLTQSVIGSSALQSLSFINADWMFLASGGVTRERGVTTSNLMDAELKRAMTHCANKVILVADSTKFGTRLSFMITPISEVHMIVTDDELSDIDAVAYEKAGPDVIRV